MFNAANFFNNRNGTKSTPYRYTTEGFSIGGPVWLPKVSPRNDPKLFFFFLNEWLGEKRPGSILNYSMPTAAERNRDFSNSHENGSASTAAPMPVKDPLNNLVTGACNRGSYRGWQLRIDVTNLWPNRIIRDQFLPEEQRFTKTNIRKLTKESPLMPSGLLGPVVLHSVRRVPLHEATQ